MASDLDVLIRQQAEDEEMDRSRWLRWRRAKRRKLVPASDLGEGGEHLIRGVIDAPSRGRDWEPPAREDDLGVTIHLMGCRPWEAWQHGDGEALLAKCQGAELRGEDILDPTVCPICGGGRLTWDTHCLGCNRHGRDGRVKWKGQPVEGSIRRAYRKGKHKGGVGA